ncbi:MAG: 4Fe-4S binding protein [Candidatus Bathyarchaeia archaeon]
MDLSVEIAGIKLRSPIILSSGPLGRSGSLIYRIAERTMVGAIATRAIGVKPCITLKGPRYVKIPNALLSTDPWSDISLEGWKKEIKKAKMAGIPIIANIQPMGTNPAEEVEKLAKTVEEAGASMIECSAYGCSNAAMATLPIGPVASAEIGKIQNPERTKTIGEVAKESVSIPIIAKLVPEVSDLLELVEVAEKAGADVISIRDTIFSGLSFNIYDGKPLLKPLAGTNWLDLSGASIKPIAIAHVFEASRKTSLPIIGIGGISSWQDAVEMLIAGASAVGLHTIALTEGPYIINRIAKGIENYLKEMNYEFVEDIKGLGIKKMEELKSSSKSYSLKLDEALCDGCGKCEMSCTYDAIKIKNHRPEILYEACTNCALCELVCPNNALKVVEV